MSAKSDRWRNSMQRGAHVRKPEVITQDGRQGPRARATRDVTPEELAAALETAVDETEVVGHNTRRAMGRCHECDRPVSGERRYCGPCLAERI